MKKSLLFAGAAMAMALASCGGDAPRTTFKITGEIPGLQDGTVVQLYIAESRKDSITEAVAANGAFVLEGSMDSPTICEIRIKADEMGQGIDFMLENAEMTIKAAHIDSVPPSFYFGADGLRLEKNMEVTGGEAQRQYNEFKEAMYPYTVAAKQAHYNLYWADDSRTIDDAEVEKRKAFLDAASASAAEARIRFINEHPEYYISAYYWADELDKPFMYSNDELDALWEKVKTCPDSMRVARLEKIIENNRKYVRDAEYTDFVMENPAGKEVKLSEVMVPGKYTMVDFWASWCGPCRASIPHVAELNKEYADNLEVLSVSVDAGEDEWKKAMAQEKMTWKQFRVPESSMDTVRDSYMLSSIPYILIFNPEGKIIFAGHDPAEVSALLAEELK